MPKKTRGKYPSTGGLTNVLLEMKSPQARFDGPRGAPRRAPCSTGGGRRGGASARERRLWENRQGTVSPEPEPQCMACCFKQPSTLLEFSRSGELNLNWLIISITSGSCFGNSLIKYRTTRQKNPFFVRCGEGTGWGIWVWRSETKCKNLRKNLASQNIYSSKTIKTSETLCESKSNAQQSIFFSWEKIDICSEYW